MSQKVWAGKLDFPAQEPSCSALENELQAELNDTEGVVHRVGDDAESRAGRSAVWRSELGVIEEIEDLGAELDVQPLHDRSALEHREVKIDYALLPKRRVSAGFVAEGPWIVWCTDVAIVSAGRCEAGGVEPGGPLPAEGTPTLVLVAPWDVVRPKGTDA